MDLKLISKEKLPVIQEKDISIEAAEEKLLQHPYGCCIVVNEAEEVCGYIDLRDCKRGTDAVSIQKKGPSFRTVDEILAFSEKNKYILYPVVDECNKLLCAYYWENNYIEIENELLQNLYFLKDNNYCMKHYCDRSNVRNVTVAIYSDINHIKSSIIFAQLICEIKDINFIGIFLMNDMKVKMKENLMNYGTNICYVDSLKDIICETDLLFVNDEKLNMLENLHVIKKRCRYLRTAINAMTNKYFNDYIAIKYKYEYKQRGIDLITFAIPTADDIGQKRKETSPKACLEFITKTIGKGDIEKGKKFNKCHYNFITNEVNDKHQKYYKDFSSESFNLISKCRKVVGTPKSYEQTIWLVGPCIVGGIYVEDIDTLGSKLQKIINEQCKRIRVVALPIPNSASRKFFFGTLESLKPVKGDCIVWMEQTFRFVKYDYDCIEEYKELVKENGTDIYYDLPVHCSAIVMEMIAEKVFNVLNDKKDIDISREYNMFVRGQTNKIGMRRELPFDDNIELKNYKEFLVQNSMTKRPVVGSIVMNCNPFTLGHQYLIEYAANQVDYLYIFVVEEDKSFFLFKDRLELVKKGTAHLGNVKVLPSGKFIISSNTFSEYFDKANLKGTQIDTSLDVETFAMQIAPVLDISVRFVGQEPLDPITNQYNMNMKDLLPKYGIELREIPRKEFGDSVISASRVRMYLKEKRWDEIKEIVPVTVYDFLREHYI